MKPIQIDYYYIMKQIAFLILTIGACIGIVSCKDTEEWSEFVPFEFETEGIVLDSNQSEHYAVIPWTGARIVIKSTGKHLKHSWHEYLSSSDNFTQLYNESPDKLDTEIESRWYGEWGTATHFKAGPPYVSEYVFNPNETGENREININISGAYIHAQIHITQLPKP